MIRGSPPHIVFQGSINHPLPPSLQCCLLAKDACHSSQQNKERDGWLRLGMTPCVQNYFNNFICLVLFQKKMHYSLKTIVGATRTKLQMVKKAKLSDLRRFLLVKTVLRWMRSDHFRVSFRII